MWEEEKWCGYKPEQLFVLCVMSKICMKNFPPGMHPFLFSVFFCSFQRVSVINMSEEEIIELLSSHGIHKRSAETPEEEEQERQEL